MKFPHQKKFEVGQKVKVHSKNCSFYGEVMGTTEQGKVLLAPRPEFKELPLSAFAHFCVWREVEFVSQQKPQYGWANKNA